MHAAFFRSVVESPDAAGGAHLGERGPLKTAATQGTFHAKLGRPWRCSLGIPVFARSQRADRVRSARLCSRSTAIPPRAPSPGKGTQTGSPSCPGRVSAAAARGRRGSPGGLARGMSPPSLRGRKCGGPESGTDSAGSCWPSLPAPFLSRPEGAPPHRAGLCSTTWAAAEKDRSACRAAGTRSWGACPRGSQGGDCGRGP